MECQIGVISGDGIGPEIVTEAKKVLDQIGNKYGHKFHYTEILMGGFCCCNCLVGKRHSCTNIDKEILINC